jgi:ribosomal-protein-alanine N-acetyltransferase
VSATLETRVVAPGDEDRVSEVWDLKERIREEEGVLRQRKGFFTRAYRKATNHLLLADGEVVGFAVVRRDGYLLFLAVAPEFRGDGHGRRLVADVASDHDSVTCHARASNEAAVSFYEHLGFEVTRSIEGYYEDGGDALYLELGESASIRDRLSEFVSRR